MLTPVLATILLLTSVGATEEHTVLRQLRYTSDNTLILDNEVTRNYELLCQSPTRHIRHWVACLQLNDEDNPTTKLAC